MDKKGFWHWRLARNRRNGVVQLLGVIWFVIAASYFLRGIEQQRQGAGFFLAFFHDPLFILAIVILVGTSIDLDYMEYRVEANKLSKEPEVSLFTRHRVIPKEYEHIYGIDFFVYLWKLRFVYIVCFLLALLHWWQTWKG